MCWSVPTSSDIVDVFVTILIQPIIMTMIITKVITLWNPVDEKVVPMEERWYRKIYSFCKGSKSDIRDRVSQS